ncbi:MAG: hypothetical protein R3F42_10155 [Pseudomonadota bacterium]
MNPVIPAGADAGRLRDCRERHPTVSEHRSLRQPFQRLRDL